MMRKPPRFIHSRQSRARAEQSRAPHIRFAGEKVGWAGWHIYGRAEIMDYELDRWIDR